MRSNLKVSNCRPAEQGYVLAAVIIMLAIMMILLAVAVPLVRKDIQRDQEVETMHRGQQYIRGVQLYYRKFHRFPPNVDALEDTNMMRFLRKRYADPLTGQDDWTPVMFGQNKAPLAMGYFGQPLDMGAAVLTGQTTSGGSQMFGASPIGSGSGSGSGFSSAFGSSSGLSGSGFKSAFGSSPGGGLAGSGFTSAFGPDPGSSGNGPNASNGGSQSTPVPGPVLGGTGIMGFAPAGEKLSILVYKTKDHYNEWEFVYDPRTDRNGGGMPFMPTPTGPPTNTGAPGFGSPTPPPAAP